MAINTSDLLAALGPLAWGVTQTDLEQLEAQLAPDQDFGSQFNWATAVLDGVGRNKTVVVQDSMRWPASGS